MKYQLMQGTAGQPVVTVYHASEKGPLASADEDLELARGDAVEVALRNEHVAEILAPSESMIAAVRAQ